MHDLLTENETRLKALLLKIRLRKLYNKNVH